MSSDLTLGWAAISWIEAFLRHGPGDVQGKRIQLDDEFAAFILKAYAVDARGARRVRRAFLSRAKGRAKSELAAMIACFEALGECRFDHWAVPGEVSDWGYAYEGGEPVGRRLPYVEIICVATEEGQAGNTYDNIYRMLHPDTASPELLDRFGRIDVGLTRINLPDYGGVIEPATAANESKDGAKSTYIVADEPLALDTPIPSPTGWTTMGDVKPGDYVFGTDGQPVLVWGVAPIKYDRPCFRVTFDDGTSVVTDAQHRWLVFDRVSKHRWIEHTTEQMAQANWYGSKRFGVPKPDPLECEPKDLPLDPYIFGLWLGDGDSRSATITVGRGDLDHVLEQLADAGCSTQVYDYDPDDGAVVVRFNHGKRYGKSGTSQHELRGLGVLRNKHVPNLYLWASVEQRLALLQGLMDSDGYVNERGNCTFTNSSRILADAVVQLARSLGWRATVGNWASDDRWQCRTTGTWRVSFTPTGLVPFRLKRKSVRCRTAVQSGNRAITSIIPVPSVPVRCIAVDSEDHLFLTGDAMLPTHNSHLWVPPGTGVNKLAKMHQTMVRNLLKRKESSGWMLETSTMYAEGEDSVAEGTHAYAKLLAESGRRDKLLFDHRQAGEHWDLSKRSERLKALREAYGPASAWMDLRAIADYWDDPQASHAEFRRFFLNQPVAVAVNAFDIARWAELAVVEEELARALLVVDVPVDRRFATIGVAGSAADGRTLVMCMREPGTGWVADAVTELVAVRDIVEVALTPGAARGVAADLAQAGIEFVKMSGVEVAASCSAFQEAVKAGTVCHVAHVSQQPLDAAVGTAKTRRMGDGETWDRGNEKIDISPLIACAAACYRYATTDSPMPAVY